LSFQFALNPEVQAGTGDVHNPHTSVPRLPDQFCTPLQQQWSGTLHYITWESLSVR